MRWSYIGVGGAGVLRAWRRWRRAADRGSAAVELALLLPLLSMITFGVIDFARVMYAYVTVASSAHEASTYLAENAGLGLTALKNATTAESANPSNSVLTFGSPGNATISCNVTGVCSSPNTIPLVSGTTYTTLFVRVKVTYSFTPLARIPLRGPINVSAVAAAPRSRALT